jgi:hypothetical protein
MKMLISFIILSLSISAFANRNHKIERGCECVQEKNGVASLYLVSFDTEEGRELSRNYVKSFNGAWALDKCQNEAQKAYLCR